MLKRRILIVEDEIMIAREIEKELQNLEYETAEIAGSGEEALNEVKKGDIDLILMDIVIKGNQDGIQTAQTIQKEFDIPVIFLTAYYDDNTRERAKIIEPFGYIIKPVQQRELQIAIEMAFYMHRAHVIVKKEREWLYTVIDNVKDGLIAVDTDDKIKFINTQAASLSGYNTDEAAGKDLVDILKMKMNDSIGKASLINKSGEKKEIIYSLKDTFDKKGDRLGSVIFFNYLEA
ncbi:MAG: response regulator [Brevinematales bacterium]|jgi:PAS domain S-box-containing protein